ncbi:S8 family serine peptidase [Mycoplasmopsis agassizii]|uniref:S8 family serine peptidase n=1 Tax=Mycoplasmopsis agassizii TaxID=33922 RepID=UPI0035275DAB
MAKAILSIANIVSASVLPIQTVSTVQTENANNHLQNYDFENLFKITRNGYDENLRLSRLYQSVEVLVRVKDHVDFSEYEKTQDISLVTKQYILQNQNFVNSIEGSLLDLSFYSISKTTPYITFVFKNRENLEGNLMFFASLNDSLSVNSYEDTNIKQNKENSQNISKLDYYYKYDTSTLEEQFEVVGALEQRKKDALFKTLMKEKIIDTEIKKIKLGIYELSGSVSKNNSLFSDKNIHYYNENNPYKYDKKDNTHTDQVTSVVVGKNGVDIFVDDIYSVYIYNSKDKLSDTKNKSTDILRKIAKYDWLISSGVKVINNSWGTLVDRETASKKKDIYGYNEGAYYLDFITRKYGIINVFAAGNKARDRDNVITGEKLSHNSIIVGSSNLKGDRLSYFSKYGTEDTRIITKPLVVAPGENYLFPLAAEDRGDFFGSLQSGTSFSAPLVSGLITMLLRNNYNLVGRPEAILAILTAGTREMNGYGKNQNNGLNSRTGAGIVNYELMEKAAKNVKTLNVNDNNKTQVIPLPELKEGQKLSVSTAWLFDAGYLESREYRPSLPKDPGGQYPTWDSNWDHLNWGSYGTNMYNYYRINYNIKRAEYDLKRQPYLKALAEYRDFDKTHSSLADSKYKNEWNSIEYLKRKYADNWYIPTDIDIKLEKLNQSTGSWDVIETSNSSTSNIEFIRTKIKESGQYRVIVYQYGNAKGKTSPKGAMTYVIT